MLVSQRLEENFEIKGAENIDRLKIQWHPAKDLLGVTFAAPNGGFLSFFTNKGGKPFYSSTLKKNIFPEIMTWHPNLPMIAVGWNTGLVSLIDPTKKLEHTYPQNNFSRIYCLEWYADELKLLAVDEMGRIKTFKLNIQQNTCNLTLFHEATIADEHSNCALIKKLNRNIFDAQGANNDKNANIQSSKSNANNDSETFTKLLNKHRKFMEFEEHKVKPTFNTNEQKYTVAFIATRKGNLYAYDIKKGGEVFSIFQADSEIRQILSVPDQFFVLLTTRGMIFYQLSFESRQANCRIKVKLGGNPEHFSMVHTTAKTIAFCYGEPEIRIWDLHNEDSGILALNPEKGYSIHDRIIGLSYSLKKECVTGFTENGKIATWCCQKHAQTKKFESAILNNWRIQNVVQLTLEKIKCVAWSPVSASLAACTENSVEIFVSQSVEFFVDTEYAVIQINPQILSLIRIVDPPETIELQLHTNIKGFFLTGDNLLLWDQAKIQLDKIIYTNDAPLTTKSVSSFDINSEIVSTAVYHKNRIILIDNDRLVINTIQGTLKKSINFREAEGLPILLDLNGNWLCAATSKGHLFIYDLQNENPKLAFRSTNFSNLINGKWEKFINIKINCAGNRVSFLIQENELTQQKLFVWEAETESIMYFEFCEGTTDQQRFEIDSIDKTNKEEMAKQRPKTAAAKKLEEQINLYKLPNYVPTKHFWDRNDSRFLVCEATPLDFDENKKGTALLTMFVTSEHGIRMHDLQWQSAKADVLIFVNVPYLYFIKNLELDDMEIDPKLEHSISTLILRRTLREFVDINPTDRRAIDAMLNFGYFLSIGQMDNAFKSIKYIKNESVWEHMAQMCVKTRRIDVARVCLGHMQNWRAARALNDCIENEDSLDLQAARLAIELGMNDEAKSIYTALNRFDLVNTVLQAEGKWEDAFEIASKYDRIHLRHTHYNYARYLESVGATEAAIENYEIAKVHHFEVPRMLCEQPKALEFYIKEKAEPQLYKWWAQYLESLNELEVAKNFYVMAKDFLSVVRLLCYSNNVEEAINVVNKTGDHAAAFHLANYFESNEQSQLAVQYFAQAGAYGTAIRLAMQYNMSDKLASFALMAGCGELVKVAQYYENMHGYTDKAVMLYHKAGMIGRALDLAFRTEQLSALDLIAQDLKADSDPRVLERAAEFFSKNQQYQKSVQLLAYAKKFSEAVSLCIRKNVIITDEIDQLLTPSKSEHMRESERIALLEEIARCCLQQGNYHLAAKKFTQAGNKIEAMRALLKSGDTQRIIQFANTARNKDIYKMVGNYLQTLNWKEDAQLMRNIENFYVKAGALESLANFYEACAQVEIDDYRDYEKALAAYNEAFRCLAKISQSTNKNESDAQTSVLPRRNSQFLFEEKQTTFHIIVEKIKRFLYAKKLFETDPGEALRILVEMSEEKGINEIIRLGDIYALIIMYNVGRNNFRKAHQLIGQCSLPPLRLGMHRFLNRATVERIYTEVGVEVPKIFDHTADDESEERGEAGDVEYSHFLRRQMDSEQ